MITMLSCFLQLNAGLEIGQLCFILKIYKTTIVFYEAKQAIKLKKTSISKTWRCKCY